MVKNAKVPKDIEPNTSRSLRVRALAAAPVRRTRKKKAKRNSVAAEERVKA